MKLFRWYFLVLLCAGLLYSFVTTTPKEKAEEIVKIETSHGDIYIWLYKETPLHRSNFLKLAKKKFFDGTLFHRVIENFMIQGGDPYSKMPEKKDSVGEGGPGYELDAEILMNNAKIFHRRGVIAAARNGDDVNPLRKSAGSQFYIVQGRKFNDSTLRIQEKRVQKGLKDSSFHFTPEQVNVYKEIGGTPWLDKQYTIFGEVISGMEVVDKIAAVKKVPQDKPEIPIAMNVRVLKMTPSQLKEKFNYTIPFN